MNYLLKYADDSISICPEKHVFSVEDDMASFVIWSTENKLVINPTMIKEIVFHRPSPCHFISAPPFSVDIHRVYIFKLLDVTLWPHMWFDEHLSKVLSICYQHLTLICQLKKQSSTCFWYENCFKCISSWEDFAC